MEHLPHRGSTVNRIGSADPAGLAATRVRSLSGAWKIRGEAAAVQTLTRLPRLNPQDQRPPVATLNEPEHGHPHQPTADHKGQSGFDFSYEPSREDVVSLGSHRGWVHKKAGKLGAKHRSVPFPTQTTKASERWRKAPKPADDSPRHSEHEHNEREPKVVPVPSQLHGFKLLKASRIATASSGRRHALGLHFNRGPVRELKAPAVRRVLQP